MNGVDRYAVSSETGRPLESPEHRARFGCQADITIVKGYSSDGYIGLYFLQRLIRDEPRLADVFEAEMERLKPITRDSTIALFKFYGDEMPFGLKRSDFEKLFDELYESRRNVVLRGDLVEV